MIKCIDRRVHTAAEEYTLSRFLTVDFNVGNIGLTDEQAFPIFESIKEELTKAWLAGCAAGLGDDQEAA